MSTERLRLLQLRSLPRPHRPISSSSVPALKPITTRVRAALSVYLYGVTDARRAAGLVIQLFPSIKKATVVVRKITPRATDLVERLWTEAPSVEIDTLTDDKASEVVKEADIICTYVPSSSPFACRDSLTLLFAQLRTL